jgi:hypothetical protein
MTDFLENLEFGVERYRDAVRKGERRALHLAQPERQTAAGHRFAHRAAKWLGKQRAGVRQSASPRPVPAHREPALR